jgi:RNA polymerase sigma factor (sigma-70 family)
MSIDTTDQDLLARVRSGDTSAFGDLYAHHSAAAHRAARRIVRDQHVAEDLVSESFARVFSALKSDNGPRGDLFPYLLVTMRNVAATWGRDTGRWTPVGDDLAFQPRDARDVAEGADAAPVDQLAVTLTSSAFTTLPRRWRTVLWYLEVEGESATEVGQRLGLTDVAVRQLARRAREGLREAYLTAYLGGAPAVGAHIPSNDLVQMARGKIAARRRVQVESHLDTCPQCTRMLLEAAEENSTLRALAIPFYVAAGLAIAKAFGSVSGVLKFGARGGKQAARGASGATAATAVTAAGVVGVVALVTAALTGQFSSGHHRSNNGAPGVVAPGSGGSTTSSASGGSLVSNSPPASTTPSSSPSATPTARPNLPGNSPGENPPSSAPGSIPSTSLANSAPPDSTSPTTDSPTTTGTSSPPTTTTPPPPNGQPFPAGPNDLAWLWVSAVGKTTLRITNNTGTAYGIEATFTVPDGTTMDPLDYCSRTSSTTFVCQLNQNGADNLQPLPAGWTSFHVFTFRDKDGNPLTLAHDKVSYRLVPVA